MNHHIPQRGTPPRIWWFIKYGLCNWCMVWSYIWIKEPSSILTWLSFSRSSSTDGHGKTHLNAVLLVLVVVTDGVVLDAKLYVEKCYIIYESLVIIAPGLPIVSAVGTVLVLLIKSTAVYLLAKKSKGTYSHLLVSSIGRPGSNFPPNPQWFLGVALIDGKCISSS